MRGKMQRNARRCCSSAVCMRNAHRDNNALGKKNGPRARSRLELLGGGRIFSCSIAKSQCQSSCGCSSISPMPSNLEYPVCLIPIDSCGVSSSSAESTGA